MYIKKKTVIIILICLAALVLIGVVVYQLWYNSTALRVRHYENSWNIDLPDKIKMNYRVNQTHIDGSVEYTVFTCKEPPSDVLFLDSARCEKEDFEKLLTQAVKGITRSEKPKIPEKYIPSFDADYKFVCLQNKGGLRFEYLYLVYYPDSTKMIICHEVSQYAHDNLIIV